MCEGVENEKPEIRYDLIDKQTKILLGIVDVEDSDLDHLRSQKKGVLKHNLYLSLQKTDYVHTSEFLDTAEKQVLLDQRRLLRDKYDRIKSDLEEASTANEVQALNLSL
jgi:hypothetical protein